MKRLKLLCKMMLAVMAMPVLTACGGDDSSDAPSTPLSLDKSSITLYVDETTILKYSGSSCVWSSDNELIASVKDGVVTAKHVGTTIIHANDLSCTVTVKPKYNSYTEPFMGWGSSKVAVKSAMSGYTIYKEADTGISYYGKGNVATYIYGFKNNVLDMSIMQISLLKSTNLVDFLSERYCILETERVSDNEFWAYFVSVDLKNYILLNVTSKNGCAVAYSKRTTTDSPTTVVMKEGIKRMIPVGSIKEDAAIPDEILSILEE